MNILFLTPQLPYPPRQGTTIRNYNLILHLSQRHTIDLLTFLAPGEILTPDSPLHTLCRRVAAVDQPLRTTSRRALDTLTTLTPDMGLRLESPAMWEILKAWTAQNPYDIVQVEGIELAQYGMHAAGRARGYRAALVFDNHNCEYLLQQRNAANDLRLPRRWPAAAYSLAQWQKLRRYEAQILDAADATVAVSEADKQAMQRIAPHARITVVSNGIDLEAYRPANSTDPTGPAGPTGTSAGGRTPTTTQGSTTTGANLDPTARPKLVFTGKMDYRPNIDAALWFGREVLPLIAAQQPHALLQLVGMNPHARLDELHGNPNVEITGAVEDTRPYIRGAAVYIIPMRVGGGTRFKALEAMALGKAIVSTSLGVEGILVASGRELLLADTPRDFAAAVLRLLQDQRGGGSLSHGLGALARAFVERQYGWQSIIPQLDIVYQQVLQQPVK
jgi:glycosyltransferase involved in cell wall biosynthesis